MTQVLKKQITYAAIICGSAVFWHLAWLIRFGSPLGLLNWLAVVHGPAERSSWFDHFGLLYFAVIPLVIFISAIVFARRGQAFRWEYPSTYSTIILLALTPATYAAIMVLLSMCFL